MGAVIAQFFVPVLKVLVSDLAVSVKYKDANVRTVIVCWMQLIKRFLSRRIPNVYLLFLAPDVVLVAVHGQSMS